MKIAYFSPLPPARTGIAAYSQDLLPALMRRCEVTLFAPGSVEMAPNGIQAFDFVSDPTVLKSLPRFDHAVYHLGNNPGFHLEILQALLLWPGPVVLHDTVLYYLAAGAGAGGLLKELLLSECAAAFAALREIMAECPDRDLLRYPFPSRYPCLARVLATAPGVLVHNKTAAHEIGATGYQGPIEIVPMLCHGADDSAPVPAASDLVLQKYGSGSSDVVFGAFGFIGPTKRLDKVLEALSRLIRSGRGSNARLLIVGEGLPIMPQIRQFRIEKHVTAIGFVRDEEFRSLISSVHVVLNLRYPSHGESSVSLIQAMACGRPCIVTNDGSFAEMPDEAVLKINPGPSEVEELESAMARLMSDTMERHRLGEAARRYVRENNTPERAAQAYVDVLASWPCRRMVELPSDAHDLEPRGTDIRRYWSDRIHSLVP